tara:strand:+ start:291 stop:974 length:684 start_codon:yes stop_codon:yes gene_type:complete
MAAINTKTISEFKTKLAGGGARPNLFEVVIPSFPSGINDAWDQEEQRDFKFLCKASQLPGSTVPAISVPFRGRILKVAGDRTFDDWTITVINDESFNLRTAFEKWMNGISKLDDGTGIVNPNSYMTDAMVRQLGRSNTAGSTDNNNGDGQQNVILRTYNFFDIFPTEVSAIDLSYDTSDTIEEFTVTFAVQYYAIGLNVNDAPDPSQEQVPRVLASNDLLTATPPAG